MKQSNEPKPKPLRKVSCIFAAHNRKLEKEQRYQKSNNPQTVGCKESYEIWKEDKYVSRIGHGIHEAYIPIIRGISVSTFLLTLQEFFEQVALTTIRTRFSLTQIKSMIRNEDFSKSSKFSTISILIWHMQLHGTCTRILTLGQFAFFVMLKKGNVTIEDVSFSWTVIFFMWWNWCSLIA